MKPVDRYDCAEAFRRLDDYLDRELTPEEMAMVREHLLECEVCAMEFKFERGVLDGVREKLRRISAPDDLRTRVLAAIRRAESPDS